MKIVPHDHPALTTVSRPVREDEIKEVAALRWPMTKLMDRAARSCGMVAHGLAANQIGDTRRFFVTRFGIVINPVILASSTDTTVYPEGCLSMPGHIVPIVRPASITVWYTDDAGKLVKLDLKSMAAKIWQHEIDHLNGINIWNHPQHQETPK